MKKADSINLGQLFYYFHWKLCIFGYKDSIIYKTIIVMNEDIVRKLQTQKNKNNPTLAIVIIVTFFMFWSFVTLIMWLPRLIILWVILCIAIVWAIVRNEKKQENLINSVRSGNFIIIETTIIDFTASTGDDFSSILWYYIISSDGSNTYKSNLLEHAFLYWDDADVDENEKHVVLKSRNGDFQIWDKISVYVDSDNPKNYFVNC